MRNIIWLFLIMLAWLSHKAQSETLCMRECPPECMKRHNEGQEIECYFFCVLNCEHCPDSPTGCPPNEETAKKLAEANLNGMEQILNKGQGTGTTRKLKN